MKKQEQLKVRHSDIDTIVYVLMVICSLGIIWLSRIFLSHAIRCAFKEE